MKFPLNINFLALPRAYHIVFNPSISYAEAINFLIPEGIPSGSEIN